MFDFHIHSQLSYDAHETPRRMVDAALRAGLKEICFTDHIDYEIGIPKETISFPLDAYHHAYDALEVPGLKIRKGVELGLTTYNRADIAEDVRQIDYDFVLGSIHHVDNTDVYLPRFWEGKTVREAELRFLETTLECVQLHDDFDVLGHLTFLSKSPSHPCPRPIPVAEYAELIDEILKTLVRKDKGLEINTSGMDRCGEFLPGGLCLRRFRELGGRIVTTGSDAHTAGRVGKYLDRAEALLKDIFGYVCTFENRIPVFHKL